MSSHHSPFEHDPGQGQTPARLDPFFEFMNLPASEYPHIDLNSEYAIPAPYPYPQSPLHSHFSSEPEAVPRGSAPSPSEQDPVAIIFGWHCATDEQALQHSCYIMKEIAKGNLAESSMDPILFQDILSIHRQTYRDKMPLVRELFSRDTEDFRVPFRYLHDLFCAWRSVCRIKVQSSQGLDIAIDDNDAEKILMCEAIVRSILRGILKHIESIKENQKLNLSGEVP
ncbi:hypothetical protein CCUS01_16212 [Colletotrichum cuscutae]|uniref:Uncharacterized protein n=1 Tax=Colletotrichum cuscutae TaxID=1209917 RepID=A0AAI9VGQ8_9PEZI|nr:hypothetical protein CCUS01_16212 [Colletotrichum cuscutae]